MNSSNDREGYAADMPATPPEGEAADYGYNMPVIPLPNPGEGGPVDPGNNGNGSNVPVIPLPNPGEGGPVDSGNGPNFPVIPLPNPGEGGPVNPGNGSNIPVIPLPNPGEGGPVGPIITVPIQPQPPCFFCGMGRTGRVRFLNAGYGYNPFRVYINNRIVVNNLGYAQLTPYGRVSGGFQTVTVTGRNGYVYLQKSMPFRADEVSTIAIINTASGLDLIQISDVPCNTPFNYSCFRVSNLAYNSRPLDVILADGRVVYSDVRFKETTAYKRIRPGTYQFYLAETDLRPMPRTQDIETLDADVVQFESSRSLASSSFTVRANSNYTMYILSRGNTADAVQVMIVEDRR